MTEQEERVIIEEAVAKIRANFEKTVEDFKTKYKAAVAGQGDFSIDTIESIWGNILHDNQEATDELIRKISNGEIEESELIKKKGRNGKLRTDTGKPR
jgi:hypothetical protein